jgi:hypothetical protein
MRRKNLMNFQPSKGKQDATKKKQCSPQVFFIGPNSTFTRNLRPKQFHRIDPSGYSGSEPDELQPDLQDFAFEELGETPEVKVYLHDEVIFVPLRVAQHEGTEGHS